MGLDGGERVVLEARVGLHGLELAQLAYRQLLTLAAAQRLLLTGLGLLFVVGLEQRALQLVQTGEHAVFGRLGLLLLLLRHARHDAHLAHEGGAPLEAFTLATAQTLRVRGLVGLFIDRLSVFAESGGDGGSAQCISLFRVLLLAGGSFRACRYAVCTRLFPLLTSHAGEDVESKEMKCWTCA
ncbi:hypothetical protein GQ600_20368 [Phytophthora cactorum]|nr:hypothetical protein GQ600_20368 [Phytophthora cactorum]